MYNAPSQTITFLLKFVNIWITLEVETRIDDFIDIDNHQSIFILKQIGTINLKNNDGKNNNFFFY